MSFHCKIVSRSPAGIYPGGQQLFGAIWGLIAFRVAHACSWITTRVHAHAHDYSVETHLFMSWNVLC
jgi:hypothetical protein